MGHISYLICQYLVGNLVFGLEKEKGSRALEEKLRKLTGSFFREISSGESRLIFPGGVNCNFNWNTGFDNLALSR